MRDYRPEEVTREARAVAAAHPTGRTPETSGEARSTPAPRRLTPGTLDARRGHRTQYVKVPDERTLLFGEEGIDLVAVEQLVGRAQMRAVGGALAWLARRLTDTGATVPEALDDVEAVLRSEGLDALDERRVGDLASFRRYELAAALNRLRSLRVV
jgi:predicted ABC-class ATPase